MSLGKRSEAEQAVTFKVRKTLSRGRGEGEREMDEGWEGEGQEVGREDGDEEDIKVAQGRRGRTKVSRGIDC